MLEMVCDLGIGEGVAETDNKVFVVSYESSDIEVYDAQMLVLLLVINVKGLEKPHDIVACRDEHELYIAGSGGIWRLSKWYQSEKWLTEPTAREFMITAMALKSRRLLVTTPRSLHQYRTPNRELIRVVKCPEYLEWITHGIETTRGTFVVGHQCKSLNEDVYAVSMNRFLLPCVQFSTVNRHTILH